MAPRATRTGDSRDQVARAHLREAQFARESGDFDAGSAALANAQAAAPDPVVAALIEKETAIVAADSALDMDAVMEVGSERMGEFEGLLPKFESQLAGLGSDTAAFGVVFAGLDQLRALSPSDGRIEGLADQLAGAVSARADTLGAAASWDEAVTLAHGAVVQLPAASTLVDKLGTLEVQRTEFKLKQEQQLVADAKQAVVDLLAQPTADRPWRASMRQRMADIQVFGEPNDPWLDETGAKLAEIYVQRALDMRGEQRFAEGANLLASAERFAPESAALASEREALAAATAAFERDQAEQERLARVDGLKQTFLSQAKANDVANAAKTLASLRTELGGNEDAFVTDEAPKRLARPYYKLATSRGEAGDFVAALRFAQACLALVRTRECAQAERDYKVGGFSAELKSILAGDDFDVASVLGMAEEVGTLDPGVFGDNELVWGNRIADRLQPMRQANPERFNELLPEAQATFPENQRLATLSPFVPDVAPAPLAAEIRDALDQALLSMAKDLIAQASKTHAEHPDIVTFKGRYNAAVRDVKPLVTEFDKQYKARSYETALATVQRALAIWKDSTSLRQRLAAVKAKIGAPPSAPGEDDAAVELDPPLISSNPCDGKLAGYGKRKKGTCFFYVAGNKKGPTIVVVPAGGAFEQPFAIGKYEVAIGDFNRYCSLSRACAGIEASKEEQALPATGVTLEQAEAYVKWLSERTKILYPNVTYRLPTAAEWAYAAEAAGEQPKKDFNCRVEQGGQILKGQGAMSVNTGKANGWGLYNYVGNVQEWVKTDAGVVARGGAFEDAFSKCDITLEKPHGGGGDGSTGFRVLLDMG